MVLAWVLSKACCGESLEYKAWDTAPRDARKTPGRHIKKQGNHQRHHSYYDHHSHWHYFFMCVIITTSIVSDCSEDRRSLVLCSMGVLGRAETYWYPDSSKEFAYFQVSNWQKACLQICFKTFAYVFPVILKISQIYVSRLYEVSHRLQCIHISAEPGRHIKKHACIVSHAKQVANMWV